jgi:hypothetical protein
MAVRQDLIEALNDCIDRLREGEDVESTLDDYPAVANQLRPMLQAGLLMPRVRFPAVEVQAAERGIEPVVREGVRQVFRSGWFGWQWLLLLLVGLGSITTVFVIHNRVDLTGAGLASPTPSQTATPSATITASSTPTPDPTLTSTALPTSTPAPSSATTISEFLIVIEGPVSLITEDVITIYDVALSLDPGDPLLDAIRVGDMLRVEASTAPDMRSLLVINITFVNLTVVVRDDLIWRGDDCAVPPPEWARDEAGGWFAECAPAAPLPGGRRPSSDDDDDDDD